MMFQTKRLTFVTCSIVLLALGITACASKVDRSTPYPYPTTYILPTEGVLAAPTFTPGRLFDCWTAPAPKASISSKNDGKLLLAFPIERGDGELNLYQFDLASKQYSLLATHIMPWPNYPISRDGKYLWYIVDARPAPVAYTYQFASATANQVPFPAGSLSNKGPGWSPDNHCLFVWGKEHAMAYRLIDGALQERSFPDTNFSPGYMVATSMDGRWWAWSCEKSVCLMNPDARATGRTELSLPVSVDPSNPDPNTAYYNPSMLWWSPDSQVLAIAYPGHDWRYRDALRLAVVDQNGVASFQDVVGGKEEWISDVRWAPDSSQVLITYLSGETDLYNLRIGKLMPLPNPEGYPHLPVAPAWSPTGKQIAFVAQDQRSLYVMNADGTNITEIPPLPKDSEGAEALAPDYRIDQVFWVP